MGCVTSPIALVLAGTSSCWLDDQSVKPKLRRKLRQANKRDRATVIGRAICDEVPALSEAARACIEMCLIQVLDRHGSTKVRGFSCTAKGYVSATFNNEWVSVLAWSTPLTGSLMAPGG